MLFSGLRTGFWHLCQECNSTFFATLSHLRWHSLVKKKKMDNFMLKWWISLCGVHEMYLYCSSKITSVLNTADILLASYPGPSRGGRERAWYTLCVHASGDPRKMWDNWILSYYTLRLSSIELHIHAKYDRHARANIYTVYRKFRQEKIFTNFITCSRWQKLIVLSCIKDCIEDVAIDLYRTDEKFFQEPFLQYKGSCVWWIF